MSWACAMVVNRYLAALFALHIVVLFALHVIQWKNCNVAAIIHVGFDKVHVHCEHANIAEVLLYHFFRCFPVLEGIHLQPGLVYECQKQMHVQASTHSFTRSEQTKTRCWTTKSGKKQGVADGCTSVMSLGFTIPPLCAR